MSTKLKDPTGISWTDPTTNTDGTALAANEISGYLVGVRSTTAAGSAPGNYPFSVSAPASAVSELLSALTPVLPPDTYVAAVQAVGASGVANNSAWSAESAPFTISPPTPTPNPPTSVQVS